MADYRDLHDARPEVQLELDEVGVAGLRRMLDILDFDSAVYAFLSARISLPRHRKGAHTSRLIETINRSLEQERLSIRELSERVVDGLLSYSVETKSASFEVRGECVLKRQTPVQKKTSFEPYEFYYSLWRSKDGKAKTVMGVTVSGITLCPTVEWVVISGMREKLSGKLPTKEVEEMLSVLPAPSHTQRVKLDLRLERNGELRLAFGELIDTVEKCIIPTFETLRVQEELQLVEDAAARNPIWVEDAVRKLFRRLAVNERVSDDVRATVSGTVLDNIHKHEVVASSSRMMGEARKELG